MEHTKVMVYRFGNDYGYIVFTVPGDEDWSDEEWDSAAQSDLESYVTTPEQYYLDDCWEKNDLVTDLTPGIGGNLWV
jgi:hypothetical protein